MAEGYADLWVVGVKPPKPHELDMEFRVGGASVLLVMMLSSPDSVMNQVIEERERDFPYLETLPFTTLSLERITIA
jgi:hypothetical protein